MQNLIALALSNSMSNSNNDRVSSMQYLKNAYQTNGFSIYLLNILNDQTQQYDKNIKKLAAIQLKNIVSKNWSIKKLKKDSYNYVHENTNLNNNLLPHNFIICDEDKIFIKQNILNIILIDSEISNIKIYLEIIYKVLKYEEQWLEYFPKVIEYLNSNDQTVIYFGLLIFYQVSKINVSVLEGKSLDYNLSLKLIYPYIEKTITNIYDILLSVNSLSDNSEYYVMNRILCKILKIYLCSLNVNNKYLISRKSQNF